MSFDSVCVKDTNYRRIYLLYQNIFSCSFEIVTGVSMQF